MSPWGGGGGVTPSTFFSPSLPGPQITWKWTMHTENLTTKCHICLHICKQGGLMCRIWDWQSTIVKDLNDSQDLKHTLFCREIVFVAIYALFSDNKCPFFSRFGGVGNLGVWWRMLWHLDICLGSWLLLRSLTIVDCQSQNPHIKPQCQPVPPVQWVGQYFSTVQT